MSEQLVISNHGPTISGEPRLCRLCGESWPCGNAMAAIREGVKAVKEGRITPANTFFEWMRAKDVRDIWEARIADLERQGKALKELVARIEIDNFYIKESQAFKDARTAVAPRGERMSLKEDILHSFVRGHPRRPDLVIRDLKTWGYDGITIHETIWELIKLGALITTFDDALGRQRVRLAATFDEALELHECPNCGQEHPVKP